MVLVHLMSGCTQGALEDEHVLQLFTCAVFEQGSQN